MSDGNTRVTIPVLVVGGGLVGLSMSLFLSRHGVPHRLVERRPGTSVHPRAWGLYPRTLELLSAVDVTAELLREAEGFAGHVLNGKVESLTGREVSVSRIPEPEDVSDISPVARILSLSQDRIEPILKRRALALGGDLRFGTELTDFAQDEEGVTATLRTVADGSVEQVRARYVVAADGSRSPLRERLGIRRHGRGTMRHQVSIVFDALLEKPLGGRRFAICQVVNDRVEGVLGHDDTLRRGTLIVTYDPNRTPAESFTRQRCVELVRAAVGDEELAVTIRSALPWEMAALSAERYGEGRLFLVGDAAHVVPPVGGYGANTGIQDAHNLAWKLALVLAGSAGPALLDTYDAERRPVATATMRQAGLRLAVRTGAARREQRAKLAEPLEVMFGYRYASAAVVAEKVENDAEEFTHPSRLRGEPGTRVPHLWLRRGNTEVSTVELAGSELLLLLDARNEGWESAARELGLCVLRVGQDVTEIKGHEAADDPARPTADGAWFERLGIGRSGAVLLRPDGFVAWRSAGTAENPKQVLAEVLAEVLARPR